MRDVCGNKDTPVEGSNKFRDTFLRQLFAELQLVGQLLTKSPVSFLARRNDTLREQKVGTTS